MTDSNPHYINELQSDFRGVKEGWYAMDDHGNLSLGPFSNREKCLTGISQSAISIVPALTRLTSDKLRNLRFA